MKLIEEIKGKNHIVSVYFHSSNDKVKYIVIPKTKNTNYPYSITKKVKSFTSKESADHYAKQF